MSRCQVAYHAEVRDDLDPLGILAALGLEPPMAVSPVTGGWDTAVWRVDYGATAFALRVFRPEQALVCRREVAALRAAREGGIAVPVVEAAGTWRDRPALVLSWCAGRPMLDVLSRQPWRVWVLATEFGRLQARIHGVAAPADLAALAPTWIDWMGPDEPALRDRLLQLSPRGDALLHLDYHPLNVMVDGARLSGVLDWANARPGDPRADLALTTAILRLFPVPPGTPRPLTLTLRRVLELAWRHGYRTFAGPTTDLAPFYAWAGAVRLRDLAPRLGKPGVWLRPEDLARIERWTASWKRRAGVLS